MTYEKDFLSIKDLTFKYEQQIYPVIEGLSCQIPLASRVAILGLNGTGKTTLLNLILGVLKPDRGDIHLVKLSSRISPINLNGVIGYLPQRENIPFNYSVNEYVLLGRLPYIPMLALPVEEDNKVVASALAALNIQDLGEKMLSEISGGELQRVRLARILAQQPDIILMDEPATFLDIKNKKSLYKLINNLHCQGRTILFSSHDPLDVQEIADFCILMNKSKRTIMIDTPSLLKNNLLTEYFETPIRV